MMRRARAMGWVVALVALVMTGTAFSALPAERQALFGVTSDFAGSSLYSIDPTTGAATLIRPVGVSRVSGMAFHPATGVLYAVGFAGVTTHVLLTIDTATGAGTLVGPTNVFTGSLCSRTVSDISFRSDGTLYAYAEPCDQLGVITPRPARSRCWATPARAMEAAGSRARRGMCCFMPGSTVSARSIRRRGC